MAGNVKKITATIVMGTTTAALVVGCGTSTGNTSSNTSSTAATTNSALSNSTSGSTSSPVDYSHASGTIVWAAPPITHTGLRKALIAAFEKQYPNIKVTLQEQNSDTDTDRASLTTAISGGAATPDVYMGDVVWPAQFASASLAQPLSDVLPSSFFDRFSDGLVQGATYNGKVFAAPFFVDTAFLFYRKDLLKKVGLPVPTTWEQLESEAQQIQKSGGAEYGFVWQGGDYEGGTCNFVEYLADAGGQVLNNNQGALTSQAANKALTFMQSLIKTGVSPKAVDTFQEADAENTFTQGKSVFLRNWSYAWSDSQNAKNSKVVGEVGVAPLPTFQGSGSNGYSCVGGWDLYVNPHTKNMAATLQFIDWMTGKDAQTILGKQFSEIPTNKEVATDPALKSVSPVFSNLTNIKYTSRPSQTPDYPKVSKAIYDNVNQALSGGASVSDALNNANNQINSALNSKGL
ncbi:ABC transporter substrate-binding protein [Alicyclobacillus dauci]|uniref:ABC transporter substrate-binding protein n=1 Tax=Alicyclobacillus dauci TaxID=1475485 RepID=A0ABY6Z5N1_9BACL|nr:ABC transporter substrate-binding protein [Alicyclobacillus dauci]WAH38176.1 ABC transporter substrate-binding protein [Alicyclobacillus dauci]